MTQQTRLDRFFGSPGTFRSSPWPVKGYSLTFIEDYFVSGAPQDRGYAYPPILPCQWASHTPMLPPPSRLLYDSVLFVIFFT